MRLPIAALLLILATSAASAETIAGRASVIDGDTIDIHGKRIRILDIDAPESKQTCARPDGIEWRCGQQAALALADWVADIEAAARADEYEARGDRGGQQVWLRITRAIDELRSVKPEETKQ